MSHTNSAAWLDAAGAKLRVGPVERYKPGRGEVLLEVHAVAINPADWAQQHKGLLIDKYPSTVGCDAAGTVVEVGEGVRRVSVGSRILAQFSVTDGQSRGAFQRYAIVPEMVAVPIPDEVPFTQACVVPLAFLTSTAGLYSKELLALPLPGFGAQSTGKTLLIWGGATSVGCMAIQLVVASGLEVITTCSPKNFELCKSLGAREVFDYNSSTVVDDIKAALRECEFAGVYEASGSEAAMRTSAEIISSLGGGILAPVGFPVQNLPDNVKVAWVNSLGFLADDRERAGYLWQEFLPRALANGQLRPLPQAEIAGKGLEAISDAITIWAKGVSAKKIVVEI